MAVGDGQQSDQSFFITASLIREMIQQLPPIEQLSLEDPLPPGTLPSLSSPLLSSLPSPSPSLPPSSLPAPSPPSALPSASPSDAPQPVLVRPAAAAANSSRRIAGMMGGIKALSSASSGGFYQVEVPRNIQEGKRKQNRRDQMNELLRNARITKQDVEVLRSNQHSSSSGGLPTLLRDREARQQWRRYLAASEKSQEAMIQGGRQPRKRNPTHPAVSEPAECYKRINSTIRRLFKSTTPPLGALAVIESQIIQFLMEEPDYDLCDFATQTPQNADSDFDFCDLKPKATKKSQGHLALTIEDSYVRMLSHGLCEYYGLNSRSENTPTGRVTIVSKRKNKFLGLPSVRLTEYLAPTV